MHRCAAHTRTRAGREKHCSQISSGLEVVMRDLMGFHAIPDV
jgi:hypothetical protein